MALTPLQRKVVKTMLAFGTLRRHLTPDGATCWRLLDVEYKPVRNIPDETISRLFNYGYLKRTDDGIFPTDEVYIAPSGRILKRITVKT